MFYAQKIVKKDKNLFYTHRKPQARWWRHFAVMSLVESEQKGTVKVPKKKKK